MSTNTTPEKQAPDGPAPDRQAVALIAGPTASGKSDLAVRLALALKERGRDAVIINADSAQVYADLRILSARPDDEEMAGIPHRLFGTWDGALACSAADWARAAKVEIAAAHAACAVPILVGGTGLYISTLLDGIAPVPAIAPAIREEVRALPTLHAYAALQVADPERAAKLAPGDSQRISRALEVVRSTGKTLGEWQQCKEGGIADEIALAPLILLPEREALYERCDKRFGQMVERGALTEVETLLARGLAPDLPIMRAIGVPELIAAIGGELTMEEAIARASQATRNYAKRQYTWLKNQPPKEWNRISPDNIDIHTHFEIILQQ